MSTTTTFQNETVVSNLPVAMSTQSVSKVSTDLNVHEESSDFVNIVYNDEAADCNSTLVAEQSTEEIEFVTLFGESYQVAEVFNDLKTIVELKTYLPEMENPLYTKFKDNIKQNGVIEPIIYIKLDDGSKLVIDGHTRLKAALQTRKKGVPSIEVAQKFNNLDDVKFWMVKQQFHRRNLSLIEKLNIAFMSKDVIREQAKINSKKGGAGKIVTNSIDTDSVIANIAGISRSTVSRYTKVMNFGNESLIKQMKSGAISIKNAADKTKDSNYINESKNKTNEKVLFEPKIINSMDEGKYILKRADIEALVIIKDTNDIKVFSNSQLAKIGFVILN